MESWTGRQSHLSQVTNIFMMVILKSDVTLYVSREHHLPGIGLGIH